MKGNCMRQPYLIQAASFFTDNGQVGLDSILELEYMGSAEFECGVVPESLSKIKKEVDKYIFCDTIVKDKTITVFCKREDFTEILEIINKLAENKLRLKEWIEFGDWLTGKKVRNDLWWDIRNHFMWWKSNSIFKTHFELLIKKN